MTDREAFDTWALSPAPDAWWGLSERERLFLAWQAATAAERERCAKVCDAIAYEWRGANSQSVQCADAIRKGE
jgi:hypothetical protein